MTPFVEISIAGRVIGGVGKRALPGQLVEYDGEHADELHLSISNYDGMLQKPRKDERVTVRLGWKETGVAKIGEFVITEIDKVGPSAQFHIVGHSADLKKTLKKQKTRAWKKDKKLGDVIKDVAKDNDLQPAIDSELEKVEIEKIIAQTGESDMHLVTRLARQYGALAKFKDGRLVFVKKGKGTTASGQPAERETITPNDCVGFTFHSGARNERGKAKATHYDRSKAKRNVEESRGGGDDGSPDYFHPHSYGTQIEALTQARSRKEDFDRAKAGFNATRAPGRIGVAPGGVAQTQGFGDDDDREWTCKKRLFGWNAQGLIVRQDFEPKEEG